MKNISLIFSQKPSFSTIFFVPLHRNFQLLQRRGNVFSQSLLHFEQCQMQWKIRWM